MEEEAVVEDHTTTMEGADEEVSVNVTAAADTVISTTDNNRGTMEDNNDTIRNDNKCLVYVESFNGFIDSELIESHFLYFN
jgi:hypothetical protein